jgi:hypothetical protein
MKEEPSVTEQFLIIVPLIILTLVWGFVLYFN